MNHTPDPTDRPDKSCPQCGLPLPPQKGGRPRKWCSPTCRQAAYEKRHGLESWKDKQAKDLSDVVEAEQERGARRTAAGALARTRQRTAPHTEGDCLHTVCADLILMAIVVESVTDMVRGFRIPNTSGGYFIARATADMTEAVTSTAFQVVRPQAPTTPPPSTGEQDTRDWPAAFGGDSDGVRHD